MKFGDTVITTKPETAIDSHLWILTSDPDLDREAILILNLTSAETFYDHTCVLGCGDHPFIRHDNCVNYAQGYVVSSYLLTDKLTKHQLEYREPMSRSVMERILQGAAMSDHLPLDHRQLLVDQELIEE
jgi:hypothetical protein